MRRQSPRHAGRQGTAAVEFALVLPVFVLVLVGTIELCNLNVNRSVVINETREATRLAINANAVESTIRDNAISQVAEMLGVETSAVTCTFTAIAPSGAERPSYAQAIKGDLIQVQISVPYSQLSIFAGGLGDTAIQVTEICTMQKE